MNSSPKERRGTLLHAPSNFEAQGLPPAIVAKGGLALMIFGGGMMLLSPVIAYLRSAGQPSVGVSPTLVFLSGIILLLSGLICRASTLAELPSFGQRASTVYKGLGILILNAVVVFVCLDLGARVIYKLRESFFPAPERVLDPREKSSYYRSQPWAAQYWREFAASRRSQYKPHVLWRRAPIKGKTINIDEQGIRVTPGANCTAGSFKVFAFGSSTMWGTGSPDWATIPAYLQSGIETMREGPLCVVNFGESGFTTTQSVIELMVQLQAGNIPDAAIFFDGTNDIYSAYQSGQANVTGNNDQFAARFEGKEIARKNPVIDLLELSSLHTLAVGLVSKLRPEVPSSPRVLTYESKGVDPTNLSNSVVQTYLSNYNIVGGIAQKYGFKFVFFWPPYIAVGKKPLTAEEVELKRAVDPALAKLYLLVYRSIEGLPQKQKNLIYLGQMFDNYEPLLWLDEVHVTPQGNELIAQRMLQVLKDRGIFN
jgi:lysophospholipase L1-like esterase